MAGEGGPEAVVLREATRRAGVTANAAYRHFADRDALLHEVCTRAQSAVGPGDRGRLAQRDARRTRPIAPGRASARSAPATSGSHAPSRGCSARPSSFPTDLRRSQSEEGAGDSGRNPFQLLSDALDEMQRGRPARRRDARRGAEFVAWSAVHGLAILAISGPLRAMPEPRLDELTAKLVGDGRKGPHHAADDNCHRESARRRPAADQAEHDTMDA